MATRRGVLMRMRCEGCGREPTRAEVTEMLSVFGHKLNGRERGLVWFCLACKNKRDRGGSS